MKPIFASTLLAATLLLSSPALAQDSTALSLPGKWSTESTGGLLLHAPKQGRTTHWEPRQKTLKGQIEFTAQDGRFVTGVYTSGRSAEKFIGMLSRDGKRFHAADSDGFWDCEILDNDTMELVYRHVKSTDSVVALGTVRRQK